MSMIYDELHWCPPSDSLEQFDGIWRPGNISAVSYPSDGNDVCFQVEEDSYWFAHRNACIEKVVAKFPPSGMIYDIGGGNGFVSAGLQAAGHAVALLEPGNGVFNARQRGLRNVIHATLEDAGLVPNSLPAACACDVMEHIEHDGAFLSTMRRLLVPGSRLYLTVPAAQMLWSDQDIYAGHFRRYSRTSLEKILSAADFEVEFSTCFFTWLALPLLLLRALPWRLRGSRLERLGGLRVTQTTHSLPRGLGTLARVIHDWELRRLGDARAISWGSSLMCVARVPAG